MTRDKTSALILNIVVLINIYDMRLIWFIDMGLIENILMNVFVVLCGVQLQLHIHF